MKNYQEYTAENFLLDERFRNWVFSNGHSDAVFWEEFKLQNPEKVKDILLAKSLLKSLDTNQENPSKAVKERVWSHIGNEMVERTNDFAYRWWMSAAAAIILLIGGLVWGLRSNTDKVAIDYANQTEAVPYGLIEKINLANHDQIVTLIDGSTVKLRPGTKISYSNFKESERNVYLDGEGIFNVTKDTSKPFLVYAGNIVVKVVGTSFKVMSGTGKSESNVSVMSGKVKVYAATIAKEASTIIDKNAILLTQNQEVVFNVQTNSFKKKLVEEPVQIMTSGKSINFNFTNKSVNEILNTIENAYGVDIKFDNKAFTNCKITAPLNDLNLYRRLDIICQTLGATYEVNGTEIVISGGVCEN